MTARRILQASTCAAILFATSAAVAEPGQVVLVGGQVVAGDIQQVVKGDYIIVKLANGELKAFAWADIASFTFGGSTSAGGAWSEQAPPPPVYTPAPPPAYPPPPYSPPPPPPLPLPRFKPTWTVGVRVGTMAVGGNVYGDNYAYDHYSSGAYYGSGPRLRMRDIASWGWMVQGDLGYHFSPSWTVYGFWEHGELSHGDLNSGSGGWGNTNAVGIGVNANSSPYSTVGFYFDVGASYRWMTFADASTAPGFIARSNTTVQGIDYLRLAVGVSINVSRKFRLDPHIYSSGGYFTRFHGGACPDGCSFSGQGIDSGFHSFSGLAIAGRYDL